MRFAGFQVVKKMASLCALLFLAATHAQLPATNSASPTPMMETNVVSEAMALIRQHKFTEARELLLPAAEKGEAEPQALLGQIYNAGWGVPVDYHQAFKWWSRAADGGSADGQWGLGLLYDDGKGIPQDSKRAAVLWKKAVARGNIKATVNLAFAYQEGRGVERDLKECARLLKIAAESGEPAAQLNFGLKVLSGEGVEQNQVLGCAWIGIAADSPRIKGSSTYAQKILAEKNRTWGELSTEDRQHAEKLKQEIQSRIRTN